MGWIKYPLLILISIAFALFLAERLLEVTDRYSDLANSNLTPGNTIRAPQPSSTETIKHPDLDYEVKRLYDEMGIRNHSGQSLNSFISPIGFFGDSFTENIRMEDRFSITSLLNQFWGKHRAINFGVDAFGPEQSFQRWLNFKDVIDLQDVVFVFCANDLRDLYEIQLFEIISSERKITLVNRYQDPSTLSLVHRVYRYLGKLRVTYLAMDAYFKLRARVKDSHTFAKIYANRFLNDAVKSAEHSYNDQYADSMEKDLLSDNPSVETKLWAQRFALILKIWKEEVEANGGRFYIAVLPFMEEKDLLPRILGDDLKKYRIIYLEPAEDSKNLSDYSTIFKYNTHWNEVGNLAAFPTFVEIFSKQGLESYSKKHIDDFVKEKLSEIVAYYKNRGGLPNPSAKR